MIEGSLYNMPFADVLQVIATGQKSGILTLTRDVYRARIYFERGQIQFAHLTPGVHLGEILVRMELLTPFEVQDILLKQSSDAVGTRFGLIAIHKGLLNAEGLNQALKVQVIETLSEVMLWKSGLFTFAERSNDASQTPVESCFDTFIMLMQVDARLRSWQQGRVKPDAIFQQSGDPTQLTLPEGSWEILGYVNGKRSAASIAAEMDMAERDVYRTLFELSDRGIICPVEFPVPEPIGLIFSRSIVMQRLLKLMVQRAGVRPFITAEEKRALEFIRDIHPNIVIIDDDKGEGWEYLRELRKEWGHLPIVIISSEQPTGLLFRFTRPKAEHLKRPFHELELQQLIGKLVGVALA
jgi:hypothetical protein